MVLSPGKKNKTGNRIWRVDLREACDDKQGSWVKSESRPEGPKGKRYPVGEGHAIKGEHLVQQP